MSLGSTLVAILDIGFLVSGCNKFNLKVVCVLSISIKQIISLKPFFLAFSVGST